MTIQPKMTASVDAWYRCVRVGLDVGVRFERVAPDDERRSPKAKPASKGLA